MNETHKVNNYLEEEKPLDLQDIVNKFIRRRNLFFYIAVPIFLGIILAQFLKSYSPIYRATFDIGVTKERPVEGFFSTYQETPTLQIGTVTQRVISNLLSVNLAEKVVDTLSLYVHIKNGSSDITIEAKIRQDFKKPIGPLKLQITGGTFKIFKNGAKLHEGRLNEFIELGDVAIRITPLTRIPDGKTYTLTIYPRNRMALALRNSLTIKVLEADKIEQEMGSGVPFSGEEVSKKLVSAKTIFPGINLIGILRISVHWGNPGDALRIAEVLSEQIITEDITEKSLQFIQSKTFIDSQLTLYQEQLNQLEEKIKQFKEGKKIADLRASTQALINQISGLESTRNQLQIEQKILSDLNRYLSSSSPTDTTPTFASSMFSDAVLQNFYSQLLQTEAELRGLLKEYSSSHPKVLEIRAKFDGLKEQVKEEVNKRTSSIKTEIAGVQSQINMLQGRLENVPEDEILLARLERDKETAEKLYTFFAEKLEETRVQEAGVTSDLRIINPPLVSSGPVNARRPFFTIFLALVIGVLAGGFAVFIAEYVDNTIKDPEMVKARINLPIFASIPVIENAEVKEEGKKANLLERIGIFSEFLKKEEVAGLRILSDDVSAPEFESFRKLSINLEFAHPEKTYRVIYVTSPGPEEGKTFIALNLGFVLGAMGKKAIVIDTDFRKKRGHLTDVTKLEKEVGLFDVLKGDVELKDVIIPFNTKKNSSAPNHLSALALLSVGRIPPNPFVFLESQKMRNLLGELKISYDYVIIDGVPILLFADATYLAKFTDGILLTARYGRTGFKELENACDILTTAQSSIIGLVINGVPITRGSYYYRYYHKYYTKYYKKE